MSVLRAFLPCRKGSERGPEKNVRPFCGYGKGLLEIKLGQLMATHGLDEVVLSTNDPDILAYARDLDEPRLIVHEREDKLCSSATSTDELVAHAQELIPNGHILWTHVTSPFVTAAMYTDMISVYRERLESGYDSLMSVTPFQSFLWDKEGPVNYDRTAEKWPRTQTLPVFNEVNSAAFIAASEVYRTESDRIGVRPYLYSMGPLESHDIDWPEDFELAECLLEKKLVSV